MKLLGIDYGLKKVGLAVSEGKLAQPRSVIRYEDIKILQREIKKVAIAEKVDKVIVGISERKMGEKSKTFSLILSRALNIPVATWDETLTTREAIGKSIEAGIGKAKRKRLEDAYAAAIMLQDYIDSGIITTTRKLGPIEDTLEGLGSRRR